MVEMWQSGSQEITHNSSDEKPPKSLWIMTAWPHVEGGIELDIRAVLLTTAAPRAVVHLSFEIMMLVGLAEIRSYSV